VPDVGPRQGVYFLANDVVLDRAIAFLNSFRRFNESMPLCLIPYANDLDQLLRLQSRYDFTIWSGDPALLRTCDEMSRSFHGPQRTEPKYRKLAAWEGEFDEFIYLDCDTVILRDVSPVFKLLGSAGFVTGYSDIPSARHLVWHDSIYQAGVLSEDQIAYAAGTGLVASRKEHLRFAEVRRRLAAALSLIPHMYLDTCDQPLLNYLIVSSGLPRTSLAVNAASGDTDTGIEWWAGVPVGEVRDGQIVSPQSPPILMVHWAGFWYQEGRDRIQSELPHLDLAALPNQDLWDYYRNL
jgi:hypothetical protein